MARTEPKRHYGTVRIKERIGYMRSQVKAGTKENLPDLSLSKRREEFTVYKAQHLAPIETQSCYVCHSPSESWHHLIPLKRGGADSPKNLVPLCKSCHRKVHRHDHRVRGRGRKKRTIVEPHQRGPALGKRPVLGVVYVPPARVVSDLAKSGREAA